jgi:hypothetical protein
MALRIFGGATGLCLLAVVVAFVLDMLPFGDAWELSEFHTIRIVCRVLDADTRQPIEGAFLCEAREDTSSTPSFRVLSDEERSEYEWALKGQHGSPSSRVGWSDESGRIELDLSGLVERAGEPGSWTYRPASMDTLFAIGKPGYQVLEVAKWTASLTHYRPGSHGRVIAEYEFEVVLLFRQAWR